MRLRKINLRSSEKIYGKLTMMVVIEIQAQ
jgi:hypothetical protein